MTAATAMTTMIIEAPMATKVVVGNALGGGTTTAVGDGCIVGGGVDVWVGGADCEGAGVTTAAAGAFDTVKAVSAVELPYELVPAKVALTR